MYSFFGIKHIRQNLNIHSHVLLFYNKNENW